MGEWWLSSWRTFERATASAFAHWISSLSFVSSHLGFSFDSASALKSQDSLWAHQRERGNPFPSTVRSLLSFSFNVCPKEGQTFIKRKEERRTSVRKETFHFLKKWKVALKATEKKDNRVTAWLTVEPEARESRSAIKLLSTRFLSFFSFITRLILRSTISFMKS